MSGCCIVKSRVFQNSKSAVNLLDSTCFKIGWIVLRQLGARCRITRTQITTILQYYKRVWYDNLDERTIEPMDAVSFNENFVVSMKLWLNQNDIMKTFLIKPEIHFYTWALVVRNTNRHI